MIPSAIMGNRKEKEESGSIRVGINFRGPQSSCSEAAKGI